MRSRFCQLAAALVVSGMMSGLYAAEPENLFPPVGKVTDAKGGGWYTNRTAGIEAKHTCDEAAQSLSLETKGASGYADWRCNVPLAPGAYTFGATFSGKSTDGRFSIAAYSFGADKPRLLGSLPLPSGTLNEYPVLMHIKVPEGSKFVRFDLTSSKSGVVRFVKPVLYAGQHSAKELKLEPPAKKKVAPELLGWTAQWVWVTDELCGKTPRASIVKTIRLDAAPEYAVVQLTADNGYRFYVNGELVGADGDWRTVEKYDLTSLLKAGENKLELAGENFDYIGGVILQGAIFMPDGREIFLKSGADWDFLVDGKDASPNRKLMSADQWPIAFQPMLPPEIKHFPVLSYTPAVRGGDIFSIGLRVPEIPAEELAKMRLTFFDAKGREAAVSARRDATVRYQKERRTLMVELPISPYVAPGTYRWKIEGLTWDIGGNDLVPEVILSAGEIPDVPAGTHYPKADGTNVMTTRAGVTQSRFVYSTVTPRLQSYWNWPRTGGHMYEVGVHAGAQRPDGSIDLAGAERNMMQILEGDPGAGIFVKLRVDVPGWWGARHPDETFVSNKGRGALQSFASDVWRNAMGELMIDVMRQLEAKPVGKGLSGVIVMGFRGGEFQLWGEDVGEYDCSPAARRAFADYQKRRNITPEIQLPHPALAYPFRQGESYARVRRIFFRFVAERQADNLIWFARTFRKAFGDRYQFGAYYGYPMEYGGSPMRMLFSGHLGADRYIKNAPLDLISCPASYALRRTPDSHAFMNPADSCILRGKLPILENDVRNFTQPGNSDSSGSTIIGMRDSLENDLRLALLAHAHGAIVRYLALSDTVDWFAPLSSIANIARINRLGMEHRPAALGAPGQVAFAIDPDSLTGIADYPRDGRFQGEFISRGRDTVMRTGRSAAFLLLDDVLDHPGKWQYVAVPLPSLLDKDKLAKLEAQFGPLPKLTPDDGVLILRPEGNVTAGTREAFWKALAAGIRTVWYIGDNFRYTWDGKTLVKR